MWITWYFFWGGGDDIDIFIWLYTPLSYQDQHLHLATSFYIMVPGLFRIDYPYRWPGTRFIRHTNPDSARARVPGYPGNIRRCLREYKRTCTQKRADKTPHEINGKDIVAMMRRSLCILCSFSPPGSHYFFPSYDM